MWAKQAASWVLGHPAIAGGSRRNGRAGITKADCRPGAGVFLRQHGGPGCAAFRDPGDRSIPAGAGVDLSAADVAAGGGVQCPDRAAAGLFRPRLAVSGLVESIRGRYIVQSGSFCFSAWLGVIFSPRWVAEGWATPSCAWGWVSCLRPARGLIGISKRARVAHLHLFKGPTVQRPFKPHRCR